MIRVGPLVSQHVLSDHNDLFKEFSFDSLVFPSCESCNSEFGILEARARSPLLGLLEQEPLSSRDFDAILDWFDKIRVGLWLGFHYFLDHNFWAIEPNFHISNRVAQADRCLIISKTTSCNWGLRFIGINTPAFAHNPGCFALIINDWCIVNVSSHFLVSRATGFPYASSLALLLGNILEVSIEPGTEKMTSPLPLFRTAIQGTLIGQPIRTRLGNTSHLHDLYDTEYVAQNTLSQFRGRVFIDRDNQASLYPEKPSLAWCPEPEGRHRYRLDKASIDILLLQNEMISMIPPSISIPTTQRELMQALFRNCIQANERLIGFIDTHSSAQRTESLGI